MKSAKRLNFKYSHGKKKKKKGNGSTYPAVKWYTYHSLILFGAEYSLLSFCDNLLAKVQFVLFQYNVNTEKSQSIFSTEVQLSA